MKTFWTSIILALLLFGSAYKVGCMYLDNIQRKHPVFITSKAGATDSEIVQVGRRIQDLIGLGHEVYFNGKPIDRHEADEMANW